MAGAKAGGRNSQKTQAIKKETIQIMVWIIIIIVEIAIILVCYYQIKSEPLLVFSIAFGLVIMDVLFFKGTKPLRTNYPEFFNLIISIYATAFGIYLGLFLTQIKEHKKDIDQTITLLLAARTDLSHSEDLLQKKMIEIMRLYGSSRQQNDSFQLYTILKREIPEFFKPTLYAALTNNVTVVQIIHPQVLRRIIAMQPVLNTYYDYLNKGIYNNVHVFRVNQEVTRINVTHTTDIIQDQLNQLKGITTVDEMLAILDDKDKARLALIHIAEKNLEPPPYSNTDIEGKPIPF
jgi:hypothetical protein